MLNIHGKPWLDQLILATSGQQLYIATEFISVHIVTSICQIAQLQILVMHGIM